MKISEIKNKIRIPIVIIVVLLILGISTVASIPNHQNDVSSSQMRDGFLVNANGQTYGTVKRLTSDEPIPNVVEPDLIACIGIDGTKGYCYKSDLHGEQPKNPEEAVEYMKNLNELKKKCEENGQEYVKYIPLYDSEGGMVIGSFGTY